VDYMHIILRRRRNREETEIIMYRLLVLHVIGVLMITAACAADGNRDAGGFRSSALNLHNYYRKQNNAPPLELDQEVKWLRLPSPQHAVFNAIRFWNTKKMILFKKNTVEQDGSCPR